MPIASRCFNHLPMRPAFPIATVLFGLLTLMAMPALLQQHWMHVKLMLVVALR